MCKGFNIYNSEAAHIVMDYAVYNNNISYRIVSYKQSNGGRVGKHLRNLSAGCKVLPISSADCETGFRQINLCHTSGVLVNSVNDLLMICVNGPPLSAWNAEKYAVLWLRSGRHVALDKATGLDRKENTWLLSTVQGCLNSTVLKSVFLSCCLTSLTLSFFLNVWLRSLFNYCRIWQSNAKYSS